MIVTSEIIKHVKSVCDFFNDTFEYKKENEGIEISNPDLGAVSLCLRLRYWEAPKEVEMDFLSHYFICKTDDIFDEDCGWKTCILIEDLK